MENGTPLYFFVLIYFSHFYKVAKKQKTDQESQNSTITITTSITTTTTNSLSTSFNNAVMALLAGMPLVTTLSFSFDFSGTILFGKLREIKTKSAGAFKKVFKIAQISILLIGDLHKAFFVDFTLFWVKYRDHKKGGAGNTKENAGTI